MRKTYMVEPNRIAIEDHRLSCDEHYLIYFLIHVVAHPLIILIKVEASFSRVNILEFACICQYVSGFDW